MLSVRITEQYGIVTEFKSLLNMIYSINKMNALYLYWISIPVFSAVAYLLVKVVMTHLEGYDSLACTRIRVLLSFYRAFHCIARQLQGFVSGTIFWKICANTAFNWIRFFGEFTSKMSSVFATPRATIVKHPVLNYAFTWWKESSITCASLKFVDHFTCVYPNLRSAWKVNNLAKFNSVQDENN